MFSARQLASFSALLGGPPPPSFFPLFCFFLSSHHAACLCLASSVSGCGQSLVLWSVLEQLKQIYLMSNCLGSLYVLPFSPLSHFSFLFPFPFPSPLPFPLLKQSCLSCGWGLF